MRKKHTKNAGRTAKAKRPPRIGAAKIMAGVRELAHAMDSRRPLDEIYTARTVEVSAPRAYSAADVRRLRGTLGVSQAVFAKLLGVSKELVEHWEQNLAAPRPMARRLLDEISRDPQAFTRRVLIGAA